MDFHSRPVVCNCRRLLESGRPGASEVVAPRGSNEVSQRRESDGGLRRCTGDGGGAIGERSGEMIVDGVRVHHVRGEEEAKRFDDALRGRRRSAVRLWTR